LCLRGNATGALSFPSIRALQSVPLHVLFAIEVKVIVRIFGSKIQWLKT
jgi:hypothetical protein